MGKPNAYTAFLSKRMPQLTAQGFSGKDAMRQISTEWAQLKAGKTPASSPSNPSKGGASMPRSSQMKGGAAVTSMRLEVPFLVEAQPDLAAAWDVAEGIVDWLQDNASGPTDRQAFARRAAAAFARAKGEGSEADGHEYRLGQALGEVLVLVMAHRGMTGNEWSTMTPPQLGAAAGVISNTVETVTGLMGLTTDINNDGSQAAAGELLGAGVEAALGLFDVSP